MNLLSESVKASGSVQQRVLRETSEFEQCKIVAEKHRFKPVGSFDDAGNPGQVVYEYMDSRGVKIHLHAVPGENPMLNDWRIELPDGSGFGAWSASALEQTLLKPALKESRDGVYCSKCGQETEIDPEEGFTSDSCPECGAGKQYLHFFHDRDLNPETGGFDREEALQTETENPSGLLRHIRSQYRPVPRKNDMPRRRTKTSANPQQLQTSFDFAKKECICGLTFTILEGGPAMGAWYKQADTVTGPTQYYQSKAARFHGRIYTTPGFHRDLYNVIAQATGASPQEVKAEQEEGFIGYDGKFYTRDDMDRQAIRQDRQRNQSPTAYFHSLGGYESLAEASKPIYCPDCGSAQLIWITRRPLARFEMMDKIHDCPQCGKTVRSEDENELCDRCKAENNEPEDTEESRKTKSVHQQVRKPMARPTKAIPMKTRYDRKREKSISRNESFLTQEELDEMGRLGKLAAAGLIGATLMGGGHYRAHAGDTLEVPQSGIEMVQPGSRSDRAIKAADAANREVQRRYDKINREHPAPGSNVTIASGPDYGDSVRRAGSDVILTLLSWKSYQKVYQETGDPAMKAQVARAGADYTHALATYKAACNAAGVPFSLGNIPGFEQSLRESLLIEDPFWNSGSTSTQPVSPASVDPLQDVPSPGESSPPGMEEFAIGPASTDSHTHTGWVNGSGNGYTSTDRGHNHGIKSWTVEPGSDGHQHTMSTNDEPEPTLKYPVQYDNFTRSREL